MTATRPKPFSESERGRIDRIKRIAAAEQEEAQRMALAALWQESKEQGWVAEALQHVEELRAQQEKQRLLDQVRMEVMVTDLDG